MSGTGTRLSAADQLLADEGLDAVGEEPLTILVVVAVKLKKEISLLHFIPELLRDGQEIDGGC